MHRLRCHTNSRCDFLEQDPLEYWTEERVKNAVPDDMPEYAPTPENVEDSPRSLSEDDQHDVDKPTALDDEKQDDQETGKTNRYCYRYMIFNADKLTLDVVDI